MSCRHLLGHASTVTCLLYPYEEHHRYDVQIIVSGSADFSVIVWNLNTGSRLHRFCVQGGPILRLLIPPENCNVSFLIRCILLFTFKVESVPVSLFCHIWIFRLVRRFVDSSDYMLYFFNAVYFTA